MLKFTDSSLPPKGIWLTDFDGTIKPAGRSFICEADKAALRRLKELGWFRVVATGRSLFSFVKAWQPGLELDALIFSSGVGLCAWDNMGPGPLLEARAIETGLFRLAVEAAKSLGFGFFAYHGPPDNHHFYYYKPENPPYGFEKRMEIFPVQFYPWTDDYFSHEAPVPISQVLMMVPAPLIDKAEEDFKRLAPGLSVIRSTSPFEDGCIWLEVFPPEVSKGRAAAALAEQLSLSASNAVALGNDFNDLDMLNWAGRSFITSDAPENMVGRYVNMPPAGEGGLAWALEQVLAAE